MARLSPSSLMYGASGKVGGLVFRQVEGKTVVQAYHESRVKRSALQLVFNDKMRLASWHAKAALRDPAVRAHYEKKKKRLKVSSAYTAACTDFMRNGRIEKIDISKYNKRQIVVKAFKADLGFEEVTVKIQSMVRDPQSTPGDRARLVVEMMKGRAVENGCWLFQGKEKWPQSENAIITVEAKDKTGNVTRVVQEPDKDLAHFHDWKGMPRQVNGAASVSGT